MSYQSIDEHFDGAAPHPLLSWLNPPSRWQVDGSRSRLLIEADAPTDFWQRTHYGFRENTGHLLKAEISPKATIAAEFECHPAHQYDQAGLMVWFSVDCWLKASVEYEPKGPGQLGAVATNAGYSDWSMQDFLREDGRFHYALRIRREESDFFVEYRSMESEPWKLIRLCHLSPASGLPCLGGIYACSPKAAGFQAEVEYLKIDCTV